MPTMEADRLATANMNAQMEEHIGSEAISLDAMWRARGCPDGQDPHTWLALARPLFNGFCAYYENLERARADSWEIDRFQDVTKYVGPGQGHQTSGRRPTLWECDEQWGPFDETPGPLSWVRGDLMTDENLARMYAIFLDVTHREIAGNYVPAPHCEDARPELNFD